MYICFTFRGHRICFQIPTLKPGQLTVPDPPNPWISGIELGEHVANDLSALASINAAAASLSPALKISFQEAVQRAVSQMHLPEETSVHLGND